MREKANKVLPDHRRKPLFISYLDVPRGPKSFLRGRRAKSVFFRTSLVTEVANAIPGIEP